ncbi:MAG: tetratricopeptide repeat protein [Candidatus Binatia bacterium]
MKVLGAIVLALSIVACGGGAQDLLDTAELEEVQNNPTHARELYREIVQRHPSSPQAKKAAERLRALESGQ